MDRVIMKRRMARQQDIRHLFAPDRKQVFEQVYTEACGWKSAIS